MTGTRWVRTIILIALGSVHASGAWAQTAEDWSVRFFVGARSDFDRWTRSPTAEQQAWMRAHYDRMLTYSPYFDQRLRWYPDAWLYTNAYAIYTDSDLVVDHPDWVLRDAEGEALYIPYGCSRGGCPQHAADIGNPEFRRHWIEDVRQTLERGYRGIYIDDVNLDWRVSDGNGDRVLPVDPRTGREMTLHAWRRYFAEFMELIRGEFPDVEIAHNAIWYATPADDTYILRQIRAADYIGLERGATDRGIVGGDGKYGVETFLAFIDRVHRLGGHVILDDDDDEGTRERDYELATYFLVNRGRDLIGADGDRSRMNPDAFWEGYRLDLGAPLGERYRRRDGILARDYECGRVLLSPPGNRRRRVQVDPDWRVFGSGESAELRLAESSAAILVPDECRRQAASVTIGGPGAHPVPSHPPGPGAVSPREAPRPPGS